MNWIVFSQISYIEALTPQVALLRYMAFKEITKVKWGHEGMA